VTVHILLSLTWSFCTSIPV